MPRRPDDEIRLFRDDADSFPGHAAAQRRLVNNGMRIYPAFESLGIVPTDSAIELIEEPLKRLGLADYQYGKILGFALAFSITMVEAERERARSQLLDSGGRPMKT